MDFSGISDFFGGIGSDISNLFGGESTPAPAPMAGADGNGATSTPAPADAGGFSAVPMDFTSGNSNFSSGGQTPMPAATGQASLPQTLSSLGISPSVLAGAAPQTNGVSASSGSAYANGVDPSNPTTPTVNATQPQSPSTMQSIMQTLGVEDKSGSLNTGGILKGLVGAGGLAYNAVKSNASTPAEKAVEQMAQGANAQGTQLQSYLANGTLPPGAQQYVDQQTAGQKASIRSKYAQMGMSGSTAEAQELAGVDTAAQSQMFQLASQLYQNGVSQTGASAQLYNTLMNAENQDNAAMGSAISNFVASLGGGGTSGGTTITIPGAKVG